MCFTFAIDVLWYSLNTRLSIALCRLVCHRAKREEWKESCMHSAHIYATPTLRVNNKHKCCYIHRWLLVIIILIASFGIDLFILFQNKTTQTSSVANNALDLWERFEVVQQSLAEPLQTCIYSSCFIILYMSKSTVFRQQNHAII